jgi:hypothetical protein
MHRINERPESTLVEAGGVELESQDEVAFEVSKDGEHGGLEGIHRGKCIWEVKSVKNGFAGVSGGPVECGDLNWVLEEVFGSHFQVRGSKSGSRGNGRSVYDGIGVFGAFVNKSGVLGGRGLGGGLIGCRHS